MGGEVFGKNPELRVEVARGSGRGGGGGTRNEGESGAAEGKGVAGAEKRQKKEREETKGVRRAAWGGGGRVRGQRSQAAGTGDEEGVKD